MLTTMSSLIYYYASTQVWIHGGGYKIGSGSLYNGEILAAKHDVVVVTINYRLGILGFFNVPGTNLKGNYGLLDQIFALKWVKKHIGDFGGDANKVTIFGESAGAGSVSLLMLSSLTKGLFSRVIAQSGSALNFWAILKTNKTQAEGFVTALGCNDLKTVTECLRKKTVQDIMKWQRARVSDSTLVSPSMDKNIFTGFPFDQVKNGKLPVSDVDLMIGFNTDEGTMFMPNVTQWDKAYFESQIRMYLSSRYGHNNELATKLVSFYYQSFVKPDSLNFRKGFKEFLDDYMFKEGIVRLALEWSKKHSNTYMYHFSYRPKYLIFPQWGVAHAMDLTFVFGMPFLIGNQFQFLISNYTEEDKEVSLKVMKMWTDFAKTGNPGMGVATIDTTSGKYFEINRNVSVKEHYDPKMMAFWNDYMPEIVKMKGSTKNDCPLSASTSNYYRQGDGIVFLATLFVGILMMMY